MRNKGLSASRLAVALTSVFILTIIFTYFDPVVEDKLYARGDEMVTAERPQALLDRYLNGWHMWIPMFLLAMFIYALSSAGESSVRREI